MNDRTSQRPPSLYTREEEAMEQYARNQGPDHDAAYLNLDAGIETNKPSGMFRFGKALANAFKPLTVWPGMWKEKEKEKSTSPEKNVLQERKVKAAEAYAELKKSGFKGTQTHSHHENQGIPEVKQKDIQNQQGPSFRDSGIDMDTGRASYESNPNDQLVGSVKTESVYQLPKIHSNKRSHNDHLIDLTEALLVPPPPKHRSTSPSPNASSARKPSLHFRKPSLQGLKKVTSQIHLSPAKKIAEAPSIPAIEVDDPPHSTVTGYIDLQRQASKKDIARHYRLSKKVSDLENKLESARRELEFSISTAPPVPGLPSQLGRKPFKPGALPSLPSERNMSPQKDEQMRSTSYEKNIPPGIERTAGRVASDAGIFQQSTGIHDVLDLETASRVRRASQPHGRRSQSQTSTGVQKRLPDLPSKTPHNSPSSFNEKIPPVPAAPKVIDYTVITQPVANSKITDHTSVQHSSRAPSPFLGPPVTASPTQSRSKSSRRGTSPPPPSLASAKKPKLDPDAAGTSTREINFDVSTNDAGDVDVDPVKKPRAVLSTPDTPPKRFDPTVTPEIEVDVDPIKSELPQKTARSLGLAAEALTEKATPEPVKEDFEWDDDVF